MSNNSIVRISIGIGAVAGAALIYAARSRSRSHRKNRSLLARSTEQARLLKHRASKLLRSAAILVDKGLDEAGRRKKGVLNAVEAGRTAWRKTAG